MDVDLDNFDFELYSVKNIKAVFNSNLKELGNREVIENSSVLGCRSQDQQEGEENPVDVTSTGENINSESSVEKDGNSSKPDEVAVEVPTNTRSNGNTSLQKKPTDKECLISDDVIVISSNKKRGRKSSRKKSTHNESLIIAVENNNTNEKGLRRSSRIKQRTSLTVPSSASQNIIFLDESFPSRSIKTKCTQVKEPKNKSFSPVKNNSIIENYSFDKDDLEESFNENISVKIIWKTNTVLKFSLRKFQKFETIFQQLADSEKLDINQIMLTFREVAVRHNDTPDTLKLQVVDFLEGGILTGVTNHGTNNLQTLNNQNKDSINLRFDDGKGVKIVLCVGLSEKMRTVMMKCAEQIDKNLNNIKFLLDGEVIDNNETPNDLGLEGDEMIEIKYL